MEKDIKKALVRCTIIVELVMLVIAVVITAVIALYCRNRFIDSQKANVQHVANLILEDVETEEDLLLAKKYIQVIESDWDIQYFSKQTSNPTFQNYMDNNKGVFVKELKNFFIIIEYNVETINDDTRQFTLKIFWILLCIVEILGIILVKFLSVYVFRNIQKKMQHIREVSEKDRMTSLFNKCRFISRISYFNTCCSSLGVIYVDVNDLKKANDCYGHDAGNELICSVAKVMRELEVEDLEAYRFGGDEFVIILPNCSENKVSKVKRELLEKIDKINLKLANLKVTVACGVAFQSKTIDVEKAVTKADKAMYNCKQKQKNQ